MKQYITVKQLNELSEKGKKRLRKWWKPTQLDHICVEKDILVGNPFKDLAKEYALPLLSIGQLIEFLEKNVSENWEWFLHAQDKILYWGKNAEQYQYDYSGGELVDGLWQATKEILGK